MVIASAPSRITSSQGRVVSNKVPLKPKIRPLINLCSSLDLFHNEKKGKIKPDLAVGKRQLNLGGGQKGNLPTIAAKVIFFLYYHKRYLTFYDLEGQTNQALVKVPIYV